jgi:basic membrane protein A
MSVLTDRAPFGVLGALALAALASVFLPAWRRPASDGLPAGGAASAADAARSSAGGRRVRVGLVFDVGGRGDKSFNDAAYRGILRAQRELGAEIAFLEPASSEDREAGLRLFAAEGLDLVVGVGFIFSSDIDAVAHAYPNVHFACVDYAPRGPVPPNVQGLAFRDEEGAFLVGAVAGLMTTTKSVGFVGGMETPLIRKFEAGYRTGVRAACPTCVVHAGYAGATPEAFRDPAKGKALAMSQVAAQADVLFHAAGATGHGVFEAAREAGVRAIGVDSDQYDEMPGTVVTSMLKHADVVVLEAVRAVVESRFQAGMRVFGVREGAIDYVHEGAHGAAIPEDVKARVAALRAELEQGVRVVPTEPR